jgi:hypothetical protein
MIKLVNWWIYYSKYSLRIGILINRRRFRVMKISKIFYYMNRQQESLIIIYKRWSKLQKDFYDSETKKFNISKIPEIYDNIRYDLKKNHQIFNNLDFKVE